jgi:hypothetical protein
MIDSQTPRALRRLCILFQITFWPLFLTAVLATQLNAQTNNAHNQQFSPRSTLSETLQFIISLPVVYRPAPPSQPLPIRVTADPPIDFEAARTAVQAQGRDIAFNKIGFHVGVGGNREGLDETIAALDAAGVPAFIKSANDAEPLYKAQQLMLTSTVPHILVYRDVDQGIHESDYGLPAEHVAAENWQSNKDVFPPELDPSLIWLETINEPDKNRAEWLAEFSLAQAKLAVVDNRRFAAFSWSSGEPETVQWESKAMLEFLRYAAEYPDNVAIALHEYSYTTASIAEGYPWLVGRFQKLFTICDKHNIPRPTILITEWGWEYQHVPTVDEAMEDIEWASRLYAAYPQVQGAAIWYLGEGDAFGSIADQAQKLITPTRDFSLSNYYVIDPNPLPIDESLFEPNFPTGFSARYGG